MATRHTRTRNPWPFSSATKRTSSTRARQPSRREMLEQISNADKRAMRAIERIQRSAPGTAAYEEALRLGKLADRHLAEIEAKAFRLYGIEPEQRGFFATIFRRPSRATRHAGTSGLGTLLHAAEARERAHRTRLTATTRVYKPVETSPARATGTRSRRAQAAPTNTAEFDTLANAAAAGKLTGDRLAAFINQFQAPREKPTSKGRRNPSRRRNLA